MLKKLKTKILAASAAATLVLAVMTPAAVMAQSPNPQAGVCTGASTLQIPADGAVAGTECNNIDGSGSGNSKVNDLIRQIINIFSVIVGAVAVVMIIVGGFRYVTSGGDSGKVGSAKNTILYALIGLVIVALAQVIVKFVLSKTVSTGP
jgi:hypothetical protein